VNTVNSDRECSTPLRLRYQLGRHCLAIVCVLAALPALLPGAELLTLDVCVATDEFPRNDHQLIFPLADGRLLLVWSEYYRTSTTKSGTQRDDMPCRISRMVSSDRTSGATWNCYVTHEWFAIRCFSACPWLHARGYDHPFLEGW